MGAPLAILICSIGVAGLFFLNRDNSIRNSKALWLPVMWLLITGSRPVSAWLGTGGGSPNSLDATLEGSPLDAAVFGALEAVAVAVLLFRRKKTSAYVALIGPIIVYLLYCLISVTWSPFPGPAFKRWIKAVGDVVMVLIIATDAHPITALRRIYSRIGFVLLPFSVVLIRYTDLGRAYDPDGVPMNTGVTLNKNALGNIAFLIALGGLWNLRSLLVHNDEPNRRRRLVAQATLLAFGLALLQMAHSATSIACFVLGSGLMLGTNLAPIRARPARVQFLCLLILLAGGLAFIGGGEAGVAHALGRKENLSGRTEIWDAIFAVPVNPVIGVGFESFWNANAGKVAEHLRGWWGIGNLVSAHNGYIEVYLDLGWIGVCLVVLILVRGYWRAYQAFQCDPQIGSLFLAYIATAASYSITEAGFRLMSWSWLFLLLAVICATGVSAGLFGAETPGIVTSRAVPSSKWAEAEILAGEGERDRAPGSRLAART